MKVRIQETLAKIIEIPAETEEEAVQMIKDYEVEPDESEPLYEFEQEAIRTEIYNGDKLIYSDGSKQL